MLTANFSKTISAHWTLSFMLQKHVLLIFHTQVNIDCKKFIIIVWKKATKCFDSPNPLSFRIIDTADSKFDLKIKEILCINLKNLI